MWVQPFLLDDSIPEDEKITWTVRRLFLNRSSGLSVMRVKHLHHWLIDATQDDTPDTTNWQKVVTRVQAFFRCGILAK